MIKEKKQCGFTVIELIITLGISCTLATFIASILGNHISQKNMLAISNEISKAQNLYERTIKKSSNCQTTFIENNISPVSVTETAPLNYPSDPLSSGYALSKVVVVSSNLLTDPTLFDRKQNIFDFTTTGSVRYPTFTFEGVRIYRSALHPQILEHHLIFSFRNSSLKWTLSAPDAKQYSIRKVYQFVALDNSTSPSQYLCNSSSITGDVEESTKKETCNAVAIAQYDTLAENCYLIPKKCPDLNQQLSGFDSNGNPVCRPANHPFARDYIDQGTGGVVGIDCTNSNDIRIECLPTGDATIPCKYRIACTANAPSVPPTPPEPEPEPEPAPESATITCSDTGTVIPGGEPCKEGHLYNVFVDGTLRSPDPTCVYYPDDHYPGPLSVCMPKPPSEPIVPSTNCPVGAGCPVAVTSIPPPPDCSNPPPCSSVVYPTLEFHPVSETVSTTNDTSKCVGGSFPTQGVPDPANPNYCYRCTRSHTSCNTFRICRILIVNYSEAMNCHLLSNPP